MDDVATGEGDNEMQYDGFQTLLIIIVSTLFVAWLRGGFTEQ